MQLVQPVYDNDSLNTCSTTTISMQWNRPRGKVTDSQLEFVKNGRVWSPTKCICFFVCRWTHLWTFRYFLNALDSLQLNYFSFEKLILFWHCSRPTKDQQSICCLSSTHKITNWSNKQLQCFKTNAAPTSECFCSRALQPQPFNMEIDALLRNLLTRSTYMK